MRKNRLIEEMNNVIDRNNRLYSKCQELESILKDKDRQVAELTAAYAEALAENDLLKAELKNLAEPSCEDHIQVAEFPVLEMSDVVAQHVNEAAADEITAEVEETEDEKQPQQHYKAEPVYASTALITEEKIKSASRSIGRVVLHCAELCNTFAATGDINSKDLINLALGRTEVFKSEVLQLATEGRDAERIQAELELKEKAVLEYFELLKKQI